MAGDKTLEGYPRYMAGSVRTEEEFEKWREFFWPMRDNAAVSRAVVIGQKEIEARLALIRQDQKAVFRSLE
jgi:hypothetical protein